MVTVTVTACGCELCSGEGNTAEHFTGILCAAGSITAFLGGNCIIQYRNNELRIPFQTDDGKLSQRYEEPTAFSGNDQFIIKEFPDLGRNLDGGIILAGTVADFFDFGAENHGVQHFYYSGGAIGIAACGAVRCAKTGVTAEYMRSAVFATEDSPFGEYGQTIQCCRAGIANGTVGQNPVVEGDINAVVVAVEGYRLDIDICVQKLCTTDPGTGTGIQQSLRTFG